MTGPLPDPRRLLRAPALAWTALLLLAALVGIPCWGGPGLRPGTLVWALGAATVALAAGVLVAVGPRARAGDRRAWRFIAAGLALYGLAIVGLALHGTPVPVPYWTDGIWMGSYACLAVGLALVGRRHGERVPACAILDGLIAGLVVMTVAAATIWDGLMRAVGHDPLATGTAVVYPLWDLTLIGVIALVLIARRRLRPLTRFGLAAGALLLTAGDVGYVERLAHGSLGPGAWYHPVYLASFVVFAAAAWAPDVRVPSIAEPSGWRSVVPGIGAIVSAVVLVWDHYEGRSVAAIVLAAITLCVVLLRTFLSFRELESLADERRLALMDDLTGLPNRRRFVRELRAETRAAGASGSGFAVLVLDVDGFKELNDTLGHDVGDRMLAEIGQRLRAQLSSEDFLARLGGDEFAVLSRPSDDPHMHWSQTAELLLAAFEGPIQVGGVPVFARASVGVALSPEHGEDGNVLLRRADVAMYQAKAAGSTWELYSPERDPFSLAQLTLASDLRAAIGRDELRVHFQPIVDVRTGRVVRAEALVRWEHPTLGLLSPDRFLAIAERTGAMPEITQTVITQAARQCCRWRRRGLDIGVAVNLSAADVMDLTLVETIRGVLQQVELRPGDLQLEITEHGVIHDHAEARAALFELRALGVGVSVDDFGTGYASLAWLRDLPVTELKIDRSFVHGIAGNRHDAAIVRSTITLGRTLGLDVVVEGVEDLETLQLARAWGADAIQGYLLGRPVPAEELPRLARAAALAWEATDPTTA